MKINQFRSSALITLCAVFSLFSQNNTNSTKPNIIVFMVDDMGWQDSSEPFWINKTPFNNLYETPNVGRLADEGVKFTQAYATAVCTPTRVSFLSGMNAARHRVTNWTSRKNRKVDREHPELEFPNWNVNGAQITDSISFSVHISPLPQLLRRNGYKTIHIGKAHFGAFQTPGADPLNLGFDINIGGHSAGSPGSYYGRDHFKRRKTPGYNDVPHLEKYHGTPIFLTEALTLEAIASIESALNEKKPFFLYLAHYAIHDPIQGDPRFENKYLKKGMHPVEASYASMIEGMDKSLGDLLNYINKKGISKNTVVIFVSDNGGLSAHSRAGEKHRHNQPLSSGKGSAHEGGIRVPMLIKWPGISTPNTISDEIVIIEDLFPTILDMSQTTPKNSIQIIDGESIKPLIMGMKRKKKRSFFWHYPNNWGPNGPGIGASSTIRSGNWKLIYYHEKRQFELFNLLTDIGETNNLSSSNPAILNELANELGAYLRSVNAQMPTDKNTGKIVEWPDEWLKKRKEN